jgi:hypothetical protein
MGVPSVSFVLWNGEPLCWRHLPLLIQDYIAVKHLTPPRPPGLKLGERQKFTIVQTAGLLGVSRDWVVKWKAVLHLGTLIGRRIYIGNAEVERLATERDRIYESQTLRRARREVTEALRANPVWISIRSKDESKPFSASMNRRVFFLWSELRSEWRKQSSSSAGGRPQKLLPSERANLTHRYQNLRTDLKQLRHALQQGNVRAKLSALQEWVCEQATYGRMRTLLLWPAFFVWAQKHREWSITSAAPNELAIAFLADQYSVGPETIRRSLLQQPS